MYTFSLPDQQSSIEIQIINDTILEEKEEQFLVEFSFLSDFVPVLISQQQALVTILDDDSEFMHIAGVYIRKRFLINYASLSVPCSNLCDE